MDTVNHMTVMNIFSGAIYTVVRDGQKFLFMKIGGEVRGITVENLPELKMYSEQVLREMGIQYFFLTREELRGYKYNEKPSASTHWNNCGTLTFLGRKKKSFVILDQVNPGQVHSFMAGVSNVTSERVAARNRRARELEKSENLWLEENQDPELMKKMKTIGLIFSVYSYVVAAVFLFFAKPYKLLSIACMAGCAVCIALEIKYPAYFTLIEAKKDAEKRGHKPRIFLAPFVILMATLVLRTMKDFSYKSWTGMVIGTAILTVVISLILGKYALEFRERKGDFAAIVLLVLFMSIGIVGQVNYLLDFSDGRIYYTEVVDQHVSTGKSTSYYCTVLLENGEEFEIQVSRDLYRQIGVGSWVKITTYDGGLGMEYVAITG